MRRKRGRAVIAFAIAGATLLLAGCTPDATDADAWEWRAVPGSAVREYVRVEGVKP